MPNHRIGRAAWCLAVVIFATPMLVPLAARDKSELKAPQAGSNSRNRRNWPALSTG